MREEGREGKEESGGEERKGGVNGPFYGS